LTSRNGSAFEEGRQTAQKLLQYALEQLRRIILRLYSIIADDDAIDNDKVGKQLRITINIVQKQQKALGCSINVLNREYGLTFAAERLRGEEKSDCF
jgi:hypothetical protein